MYPPASGQRCAPARRQFTSIALAALLLLSNFIFKSPFTPSVYADTTTAVSLTAFGTPVTQNFDTLVSSGAGTLPLNTPAGWGFVETGTNANTSYTAGDGSANTGDTYSFGTTAADRALGQLRSGSLISVIGARFTNNTGGSINSLSIAYIGEQWRLGEPSRTGTTSIAERMDFQYSTDATSLTTGTWTDANALDFVPPIISGTVGKLDGNAAANRAAIAGGIPSLSIANGATFWIRWTDVNATGSDDGLAIDDFSITPSGTPDPLPALAINDVSKDEGSGGGTTPFVFTVSLSAPANNVTFDICTQDGTAQDGGAGEDSDYTKFCLTNQSVPNGNTRQTFQIDVAADTNVEPNENFTVNVTNVNGATVTDSQGLGTIVNDDFAPTDPTGTGSASPNPVQAGNSSLLTVAVTPGAHPASTGIAVTGDLSSIGGSAAQQFYDDGTHGDAAAGNNVFSYSATVAAATSTGLKSLPVQITDAQGRLGAASISLSVQAAPPPAGSVVISQVYGGGGNSGATYRNDFIEIFNRSQNPVDLTGWSVQYASAAGTSWNVSPLTGFVLQPGQYYLIQQAAGTGGSVNLPTPDATGTTGMGAENAKVALMRTTVALSGSSPVGNPDLMDFIGYGSANAYEGTAAAPRLSNTTAALRARNGCKDTDQNNVNFVAGAPTPRNTSTPFNVCPTGDFPPEVSSTNPANGGTNFPLAGNITVNFDDAVTVQDGGFTLSCTTSGAHTLAVTGGPTTFTLNPDTDLASGEQCTATVLASHVASQGATPVPMAADYAWTFVTLIVRNPADHMVMGNPSGAVTDVNQPLNYLMMKPQYALSYNNDKGIPNWTSWHLDSTWTTSVADRQNDFRPDDTLPAGFKRVAGGYNFATYGFDRGHMVPSADRTSSVEDNSSTFLMTNIIPQASGNNQGPWANLENYTRTLLNGSANELYIVSGGHGVGGTSTTGNWDSIVDTAGNSVTVPNLTWKVFLVLPRANGNDVARVDTSTRTFAVIMPNRDNIRSDDWRKYIATVDQVEALTGYDFFSNVPDHIEAVIEAQLDAEYNTAPVANDQSVATPEDTQKQITLTSSDFNVNNTFTYTVVSGPANGVLGGTGRELTYTPNADYNGPDSFTFKVSDGGKESNTATVNINVTSANDAPTANGDQKATNEDTTLSFPASDLAANDSAGPADEGGQTLSVTSVIAGANTNGTVSLAGGQVTYTPAANFHGPASFDYQVCDNGTTNGSPDPKCATATVDVTVSPVNDAPTLSNVPAAATIPELAEYAFAAQGADVDGDTLSYSLVNAPAGASINPATGQFAWTPAEAQGGTGSPFQFTVRVSDGTASAERSVTLTVTEVNQAPTLAPIGDKTAFLGSTLMFAVSGADADLPAQTLTYSLTGAFPAGASINPATGVFNWTPTAAQAGQVYTFTVRVTDNGAGQLYAQETIRVGAAYTWSGYLQPINPDGSSLFNAGQTVPVKFQLTGASAGVTNAVARLWVAKVTDNVVGTESKAGSTSAATEGHLFRYSDGQYIFNLSTNGLATGTYQLRVDTGDGVPRLVNISLR